MEYPGRMGAVGGGCMRGDLGHRRALTRTAGLVGCILLRSAEAMSLPEFLSVTYYMQDGC